jgi:hypothetical protein
VALASEDTGRGLGGFLSRLGGRRATDVEPRGRSEEPVTTAAPAYPTKALRKFLSTLAGREAPVLLDLGPVIGSNLSFFGETLGCKVFIEDLYADVERHLKAGTSADLPDFIRKRLAHPNGSIDGVLAWDLIDYLDLPAAQALAAELVRVMRADAALLGFFGTATPRGDLQYTKYVVIDDQTLRHRSYPASRGRQRVLQNRDIIRMFDGLRVSESFLLQTNLREILFRKPAYLAAAQSTA